MSYYLLPSKISPVEFVPVISDSTTIEPFISPSLNNYHKLLDDQIRTIIKDDPCGHTIDFLLTVINTYEYIFTKVPGTKFSVAKMKPHSASFYIFLEIINILNLFDSFQHKKIKYLFYGSNSKSMNDCMDILRENFFDIQVEVNDLINCKDIVCNIDFFYFELDETFYNDKKLYIREFLFFLSNILQFQSDGGVSIIKISSLTDKPILDIIYFMTSLYEKVYIAKPLVSNLYNSEKFIVCKNFKLSLDNVKYYLQSIHSILVCLPTNKLITTILKKPLPYYFLNKVDEANIIIGHQQLETMEQLINLIKNKNREEKIESLKKSNIQKCVQWCEKYKIPYNKFSEKINIFLNCTNDGETTNTRENNIICVENENSLVYR
jgi:hypothetical protein